MGTKIINNKPYSISNYWKILKKDGFLIRVLAKRELKVKYSRTFIGIGWLFLQPLIVVAVYTIFFRNLIKLNTDDIPYPAFVLSGLVIWYLFTNILSKCAYALVESSDLINKVSFPRIIILISKIMPIILECFILLVFAFIIVWLTQTTITLNSISALFYFILAVILSFSLGIMVSILTLKYRDLVHAIPFIINFGIWLTPVFYSISIVPDDYKNVFRFGNPLTIILEGLRGALFLNQGISATSWLLFILSCLLLVISFFIFVKFEKKIVENL